MNNLKVEIIDGKLSPEDQKVMIDRLLSHHASRGHPKNFLK